MLNRSSIDGFGLCSWFCVFMIKTCVYGSFFISLFQSQQFGLLMHNQVKILAKLSQLSHEILGILVNVEFITHENSEILKNYVFFSPFLLKKKKLSS